MAEKQNSNNEPLPDIPSSTEENQKTKKLREAPDEVLAKALHDWILKDQEDN